jgi:hypothetical protein
MPKFCIFCGERPEEKNDEHVLPRWLLEMTGDPNRHVPLSLDIDYEQKVMRQRIFAFSHFKFPACEPCNTRFGLLEGAVRQIISMLLDRKPITDAQIHMLLDWLDKVRVGLWLAQQQLTGNVFQLRPHFYVANRVGRSDRAVFISRLAPSRGLTVMGVQTPMFAVMPCVFAIRINDVLLFNAATDHLFSERIGFPYPIRREALPDTRAYYVQLSEGRERTVLPLIAHPFFMRAARFFQPMFPLWVGEPKLRKFFDTPYVRDRAADWEGGIGRVFKDVMTGLTTFKAIASGDYDAMEVYDQPTLERDYMAAVLDWQNFMVRFPRRLPRNEAKRRNMQMRFCVRVNRDLIARIFEAHDENHGP